jgi:hypothetical protein
MIPMSAERKRWIEAPPAARLMVSARRPRVLGRLGQHLIFSSPHMHEKVDNVYAVIMARMDRDKRRDGAST